MCKCVCMVSIVKCREASNLSTHTHTHHSSPHAGTAQANPQGPVMHLLLPSHLQPILLPLACIHIHSNKPLFKVHWNPQDGIRRLDIRILCRTVILLPLLLLLWFPSLTLRPLLGELEPDGTQPIPTSSLAVLEYGKLEIVCNWGYSLRLYTVNSPYSLWSYLLFVFPQQLSSLHHCHLSHEGLPSSRLWPSLLRLTAP